jgi:PAS domain S-box-containing protein
MRAANGAARILVVEDERIVAKDITSSLERLGYAVTGIASSGEEAVRMVGERPPDLILMDVVLKGDVDGIDAAERIRTQHDVPVIYLTAYADSTTLERAKGTVPYGYLLKPWQERELRTVIEIALHKHMLEQRLTESERWLAMTLSSIGDAVVATNEQGAIVLMNGVAESITGWRRTDAVGQDAAEVVRLSRAADAATPHPLKQALGAGVGVSLADDFRLVARDGREIDVGDSAAPIRDDKGNLKGAVLVFRDVTEKKRAEDAQARLHRALETAATEWRLTFDAIEAPVLILDFSGRVVRLNAAGQQLARRPYEACIGVPVGTLGVEQPWPEAAQVVEAVRHEQANVQHQVRDPTTGRTWDLAANVWSQPGEERRVILVATDITRLMELQESLRRSETMSAMGSLVAGVAHEARNPLFGISANLDALEAAQPAAAGQSHEVVTHMRQALNRLTGLMQQLLDYGKPPAPEFAEGALGDVIAEAVDACRPLTERAEVKIVSRVPAGLVPLRMDRQRLVQLIENLLENAIQHSPKGSEVVVEAAPVLEGERDFIEARISDRGPGFSEQDLTKVFEPFFTRRRGGTGLGLSIVQRIVQDHGGHIHAGNRREGGAEMVVRLPVE